MFTSALHSWRLFWRGQQFLPGIVRAVVQAGGTSGGCRVVNGPQSSSFLPTRGVVIPDAVRTKCFVLEGGNCCGGLSLARMGGSKRCLWGGSGPRSSCVWCARALVMPDAQSSQCWPFRLGRDCHFGGEYCSGGDFCFGGRAVAG